jgi:glutamyl-tRNA reductase
MVQPKTDKPPLVVVGCDFRVASTLWRERMALSKQERIELFKTLNRLDRESGIVFLVTCNRSEWIVSAYEPGWIGDLLFSHLNYIWEDLSGSRGYVPAPYMHVGHEAARHVFRVVAGLESFVMGEQQIAHQFHVAVKLARDDKTSTTILNGLEKLAGSMTKKLRDRNLQRTQSVGIHSIVARFVEKNFPKHGSGRKGAVAVAGMGQIGRKVAGLLEGSGSWNVLRLNRTLKSSSWLSMDRLGDVLGDVEGVIFCTGSEMPVVKLSQLCRRRKRKRPLWIVDIGVPAQVEIDGKGCRNIELVGLDRLVQEPEDRMYSRWVSQVEEEIESAVKNFEIFCRERSMVHFLDASQEYIEHVIPSFVKDNFSHLPPADRKRLVSRMRKLLIEYSNSLLRNFHSSF